MIIGNAFRDQLSAPPSSTNLSSSLPSLFSFLWFLVEGMSHFLCNLTFSSHALDPVHSAIPEFLLFHITSVFLNL